MQTKTILITGATSGIGFYVAKALANQHTKIIITGRNETRGREAAAELRQHTNHPDIHFIAVDHSLIGANRDLAARIVHEFDHLDVLINNVGGLPSGQRRETLDGYELTLAMNFLGPFVLTNELLALLHQSAPARIINVISSAHNMWQKDPLDNVHGREEFVGIHAYAHTKLLNLLWTFALARRLEGSGVTVNATNPGMAWTPGTEALTPEAIPAWRLFWPVFRWIQRRGSPEKAAQSCIFLATSSEIANVTGKYFESNAKPAQPSPLALETENQERVWELGKSLSEQVLAKEFSGA